MQSKLFKKIIILESWNLANSGDTLWYYTTIKNWTLLNHDKPAPQVYLQLVIAGYPNSFKFFGWQQLIWWQYTMPYDIRLKSAPTKYLCPLVPEIPELSYLTWLISFCQSTNRNPLHLKPFRHMKPLIEYRPHILLHWEVLEKW